MFIRTWGSRGSIPVSGKQYNKYGGDTTCIELISNNGELVIIDAGSGIRTLGNRLKINGPRRLNLLLTHMHLDHVSGFHSSNLITEKILPLISWGQVAVRF